MESKSRARATSPALWLAPLVLALQACGFPAPEACALACGEQGACPGGFECQASSQLCVPVGTREACLSEVAQPNQPDQATDGALSGASSGGTDAIDAGPATMGAGGAPDLPESGVDAGAKVPARELGIAVDSMPPGLCSGSELHPALRASGGVSPYAWQLVTAPEGVALSSESGSEVQLAGVPQESGSIVVALEDGAGDVSSLVLEVFESPRLIGSLPALCAGQAYAAPLLASGGNSDDYVWSAQLVPAAGSPGSLAELGLSLQGATLSAEASAPIAEQSAARVALAVRDAHCSSAPLEVELEVRPADSAECPSVQLSTPPDALPDACLGNFYAEPLTAAGGEPPYLWSALSVPPGLHFDAESALLSGVPEGDGVLELQLSDQRGRTLQRRYELHARERCWLAYLASEPVPRLELVDPVLLERQPESARRELPEQGADPVLDFQFSPDGRFIAYRIASAAGSARLELASVAGAEAQALELGGAVGAYAWSPDSATLAVAYTRAQQPRLGGVDVAGGGRLLESRAVAGVPSRLSWYDATHVALLTPDPEVSSLYWLSTAERSADGYSAPVAHADVGFSPAAQPIAGAGGVFVSDPGSNSLEFFPSTGEAPSAQASAAVVAPSGAFVGLARDGALQVFRPLQSSALADPASVPFASAAGCDSLLAWGQVRQRIACAASVEGAAALALFEVGSDGALSSSTLPLAGLGASGQRRAFSQSGRWFAAASADRLVVVNTSGRTRLWGAVPNTLLGTAPGALVFSPDESSLLIGAGNALELLDLTADAPAPRQLSASALGGGGGCSERFLDGQWCGSTALDAAPVWSSDSRWVAFPTALGTLELIDVRPGAESAPALAPDSACSEACRSANSARFQP
jgi:hypothetical protein